MDQVARKLNSALHQPAVTAVLSQVPRAYGAARFKPELPARNSLPARSARQLRPTVMQRCFFRAAPTSGRSEHHTKFPEERSTCRNDRETHIKHRRQKRLYTGAWSAAEFILHALLALPAAKTKCAAQACANNSQAANPSLYTGGFHQESSVCCGFCSFSTAGLNVQNPT